MSNPSLKKTARQAARQYLTTVGDVDRVHNLLDTFVSEVEKPLIDEVLKQVNGNNTLAARMLGISRNTLLKKMKTYQLNRENYL
jgi:Fis family transcriptional regulator, factor for inversion stimulation protein